MYLKGSGGALKGVEEFWIWKLLKSGNLTGLAVYQRDNGLRGALKGVEDFRIWNLHESGNLSGLGL